MLSAHPQPTKDINNKSWQNINCSTIHGLDAIIFSCDSLDYYIEYLYNGKL